MSCIQRPSIVTGIEERPTFPRLAVDPGRGGADVPAPPLARQAAAARAPLGRTLRFITLGWVFGAVWFNATGGAPLTLFAKGLNASPFQFGVLAALPFIASLISLPASLLIERTGWRKGIFLGALYFQRLMWFPLALVPLWIVSRHGAGAAGWAMWAFLGLFLLMHAGQAVGGPAWVSWMADTVPERVRGKFFSRRRQWGIVSAIPAALLVGWVLDHYAIPGGGLSTLQWCAVIFACAALFGLADIFFFQLVPAVPRAPQCGRTLLRAFVEPLRNRQFLCFAGFVGTLTFAVSSMGQFVTLYLIDRVGVRGTDTQLMLLVIPMVAQLLVLPAWGRAVDRMGKKPVLAVASLGLVPVGLGWVLIGGGNAWWLGYALAAAGTALWTGVEIANFNYVLEMSGSDAGAGTKGGSAYVAVNSVVINVAGCLGGLAAGGVAQLLHDWSWQPVAGWKAFSSYDVLFVMTGLLRLAAVAVFLPFLHEPAARPAAEALRFVGANIYNNLSSAVLQPLRFIKLKKSGGFARAEAPPLRRAA